MEALDRVPQRHGNQVFAIHETSGNLTGARKEVGCPLNRSEHAQRQDPADSERVGNYVRDLQQLLADYLCRHEWEC
jgi:hypothetical protein